MASSVLQKFLGIATSFSNTSDSNQIIQNMFTQEQTERKGRHRKNAGYLVLNQSKVNTKVLLKQALQEYKETLEVIDPQGAGKAANSTGITQTKGEAKEAFGRHYEEVCADATVYCATKEGDFLQLLPAFKYSYRKILRLKDEEIVSFATDINKLVTDKILSQPDAATSDIDAATLTAGMTLATNFQSKIGAADIVNAGKTAANIDVDGTINKLDKILELRIEPGMKKFKNSDPNFYNGFLAINRIDEIGDSATGIAGDVTFNGQPAPGATITIEGIKKTGTSDLTGRYEIPRFKPGTYTVTCTHPTHGIKTMVVKVKLGKMLEVDFEY